MTNAFRYARGLLLGYATVAGAAAVLTIAGAAILAFPIVATGLLAGFAAGMVATRLLHGYSLKLRLAPLLAMFPH